MLLCLDLLAAVLPLHSNLVIFQQKSCQGVQTMTLPLHSNLVIFQLGETRYNSFIYNFTFQSGYIPTSTCDRVIPHMPSLHSNLVIFQLTIRCRIACFVVLYIPIWLYSNFLAVAMLYPPYFSW